MKIKRAYKYRLYPTKEQETKMLWTLEMCRFVYNKLLEELNKGKKSKKELQHSILKIKEENPELLNAYAKVLQYENYRLFSSLRTLAKLKNNGKRVGRLRFKSKDRFRTFNYNQYGFEIIKNNTRYDKLWLSRIGEIPFIMHREIDGKIKQVAVKRYPSGKWFASIITEVEGNKQKTNRINSVGIDLGINNYIYDSNGTHFDSPKYLNKFIRKLKKEQTCFSRKTKDSRNREKQKVRVAKIHEKIMNHRTDFLRKLSRHYVNNFGFIAVEDLNIKNLIEVSYNSRNIMDASWSRFVQMLEYKAESASVQVMKVEPEETTQICSNCRITVPKHLWNRTHKCTCGLEIDRDYNSAINILKRALGQELSESTPVEREPLLAEMQASNLEETGSHILNVKH